MKRFEFLNHIDRYVNEPLDDDAEKHKEALVSEFDRLNNGLQDIKKHLEITGGSMVQISGAYQMVCKLLNNQSD